MNYFENGICLFCNSKAGEKFFSGSSESYDSCDCPGRLNWIKAKTALEESTKIALLHQEQRKLLDQARDYELLLQQRQERLFEIKDLLTPKPILEPGQALNSKGEVVGRPYPKELQKVPLRPGFAYAGRGDITNSVRDRDASILDGSKQWTAPTAYGTLPTDHYALRVDSPDFHLFKP
jgi:hypothetical protein